MNLLKKLICNSATPFIWLFFSICVFYFYDGNSVTDHNIFLIYTYISYILCLYNWISKGNRFFSLFVLFVLFSLFYNTSQSLVFALTRKYQLLYVYNNYNISDVCYMLKYQFMCISGFYLGSDLYLRKKNHNVSQSKIISYYRHKKSVHIKNEKILFKLFLLCAFFVFGFTVYQLLLRQSMSYSELYENRETISPYFSLGTLLIGLYFIYQKKHVKLVYFFYFWFIIAYTLAGTRSMSIVYVAALWLTVPMVYPQYFQKKYYPIILLLAILAIASINIISQMRTSVISDGSYTASGEMGILFSSLKEMGTSQVPTMITIEHIQQQGYSQTILYFLMLSIFPSAILTQILPVSWQLRIGAWTTDVSNTTFTQWGSSWLAEGYINYGEFAWIFTLVYGYLIVWAENNSIKRIMKGKYLLAICMLTCLCKQIFFARGEMYLLIDYFKPCIYIGIIWIILNINRLYNNESCNFSRRLRY